MLGVVTIEWVREESTVLSISISKFLLSAYKDEKTKKFDTHGHPLSDASRRAFEKAGGASKGLTHCLTPGALSLACESSATWIAMSADEFDWMLRATFYR